MELLTETPNSKIDRLELQCAMALAELAQQNSLNIPKRACYNK